MLKHMYTKCCKPGSKPNGICGFKKLASPCDDPSDFNGDTEVDGGHTCTQMSAFIIPSSAGECRAKIDESTSKADALKYLYAKCCKPGSKPNGVCGFKVTSPCDNPSDFNGGEKYDEEHTCAQISAFILPSSARGGSTKLEDTHITKADTLKHMYTKCCKPGSEPNGICGFKLSTATPCQSKAANEFLPEAM